MRPAPVVLVVLSLLASGCELVGGGLIDSIVTEQPSPGLPRLDGTFADSFDEKDGRWPVTTGTAGQTESGSASEASEDSAEIAYREGGYQVTLPAGRHLVPTAPVTYTSDVSVTVGAKALRLDQPGRRLGGVWGLACDADDEQSYYFAGVQTTLGVGYAGIGKVEESRIRSIVPFGQPHRTIDADGVNDLQMQCSGAAGERTITFTINGEVVAEGTDRNAADEPRPVAAGLVVDTSSLPRGRPFIVRFDEFSLSEEGG
ncbi:MAG: hypothetical protein GEU74_08035 [Nitriliruptorales bacterium]|nr:hypothetical protein [Nitriliruptorales bacterium]